MPGMVPPFSPKNSNPTYTNLQPQNLLKWRIAVAKMRVPASTYHPKLLIISDSSGAGAGAGTGGSFNYNAAFPNSWPSELATMLTAAGIPAQTDNAYGRRANTVTATAYDTRLGMTGNWSTLTGFPCLGGDEFKTTDTTGILSFTPASAFDRIYYSYLQQSGSPSFTINIDGGAAIETVNASGANALTYHTLTVALGTHTINIQSTTAGTLYIPSIDTYASATPKVNVINASFGGSTSTSWAQTTSYFNPIYAIPIVAPDLSIISLGYNDKNTSISADTYKANIQALITACQTSGDVILVQQPPADPAGGYGGRTATLAELAALKELSIANSVPLIDLDARWSGLWTNVTAAGFNYDNVHLSNYQDQAAAIFKAVVHPIL